MQKNFTVLPATLIPKAGYYPLRDLVWKVMKISMIQLVITMIFSGLAVAHDSRAQEILNREVSLNMKDVPLRKALTQLEATTKVRFVYSRNHLKLDDRISIDVDKKTLGEVLNELLAPREIQYKVQDNNDYIVLTPRKKVKDDSASLLETPSLMENEFVATIVSGKVTADSGDPLPGVNVLVKGSTTGTTTNSDGEYKIEVPEGNVTLVFSFIGYATQEISLEGKTTIDVVMAEDIQSLAEVVVVGYGTQEKKEVTAAISQISNKDLMKSSAVSVSNALAGRLPGLIVNQRNSEPGNDDATIFIRGKSTTGNANALIVIDGVANRDGISRIDPNDIESITVLKDASAAIYGAQSGNGVVLITTKRGKAGKPSLNYSFNQGFVSPTRVVKMADAGLFMRSVNTDDVNNGRPQTFTTDQINQYESGALPTTDWVDAVFKPYSLQNRHSLTMTGGNETIKYFLSGGTAFQNGLVRGDETTEYRQYNLRSNVDVQMSKRLSIGFDLAGRRENRNFLQVDQNTLFSATLLATPITPATTSTGLPTAGRFNQNPLAVVKGPGYDKLERNVVNGTFKFKYDLPFIEGLYVDGFAALDFVQDFTKRWVQPYTYYSEDASGVITSQKSSTSPTLREVFYRSQSVTLNAKLNYSRSFGDHNLSAFLAYEQNEFKNDSLYVERSGFESDQVDQLFAGSANGQSSDGRARETARQNYFGRLSYSFMDKYMVQFHFRYDGTNIFPKNERFGFFPGVSLGWRLSEETFLQDNPVISNLKLRASWGKLGNDRIKPFQYLALFSYPSNGRGYVIGDNNVNILNPGVAPNPNVTWEKKTTIDVGVEAGFFNNRLTLEFDIFSEKNRDILWPRNATVPQYTGLSLPNENIGEVDNKGFDAQIMYTNTIGDGLRFNIGGNVTYARNKVVYIDEGTTFPAWQLRTGKAVGDVTSFTNDLAYDVIGIYRTQQDLDSNPGFSDKKLGDLIYRDVNEDGKITGDDRIRLDRTSTPQLQYGITLGAEFKGFDFSALFQGQARAQQYLTYNFSANSNGIEYFLENAWSAENPNAKLPTVNRSKDINTLWARDVSFLRLKSIELGYTIPKTVLSRIGLQTVRFYVNAYNLLTFDKLKKDNLPDPENINIQSWRYPHTKSINFGLNLTL